tara:strand:+ start:262 stop:654 length:393 start_codon:yes stop_codon:yes gene_type:complete
MQIEKKVFSKLFKEKTNLSKIDEIQAIVVSARNTRESWDNTLTSLYDDLFNLVGRFSEVKDLYNSYASDVDTVKEDYKDLKEDISELGIEINAVQYTGEIEAFINTSDDVYAEMIEAVGIFERLNNNLKI